jgi:hypothetical protein
MVTGSTGASGSAAAFSCALHVRGCTSAKISAASIKTNDSFLSMMKLDRHALLLLSSNVIDVQ